MDDLLEKVYKEVANDFPQLVELWGEELIKQTIASLICRWYIKEEDYKK